jgi:iron complex transport system ATP-binding protein
VTEASGPPLLELRRVTVMRGGKAALEDLSLRIERGEHVAILGPNGCGKSTLIKTITRECYPLARDDSSISILGRSRWDVFQLRRHLGIVSADLFAHSLHDITGQEMVVSGFFSSAGVWQNHEVTPEMRARADEVLEWLEVPHLRDRLVTEMSSGEARRIQIGRALVHDPGALLLDEPTTSLDLHAQHELNEALRPLARAGVAILLVTHHLADVIPEIDRVILLREGRIIADGDKREILTAPRLSELFGRPVELARRDGYFHAW